MEKWQVALMGDSILKGIQMDPVTERYINKNDMELSTLEAEFDLSISNHSAFGADCHHGQKLLERLCRKNPETELVLMDFGGNDCNHDWAAVAQNPEKAHLPNVPLAEFLEVYRSLIREVRQRGMQPVLMTLPPLVPERFLPWWSRGLDLSAVERFVGCPSNIYAHQENYSRAVERLSREEGTPLVDLRASFLAYGHLEELMCLDGTHPNSRGQALIHNALEDFFRREQAKMQR